MPARPDAAAPGLPNIVYIMADDMGYGDLGCYGATKVPTPNMDRVAAEGMRFTDAHSSSSVCTPSRYSVLTGRYCWRTQRKRGVAGGFSFPLIDPARTTLASMLKPIGYATAAVGKWHVGLDWQFKQGMEPATERSRIEGLPWEDIGIVDYRRPFLGGPTCLGFDTFFGIAGSLDMPPYCFLQNDRTLGIPEVEKDPYNAQQKKGTMTPGWQDEEVDRTFCAKAVEFIEDHHRRSPEAPFLLYLTPSAPHRPCMPPLDFQGASQAGPRGDMVCVVDWMVGQVDATLSRLGLKDNTLIIVTSDNGARPCDVDGNDYGHRSCGELRGYKADIWDGGHREPFIVRWPQRVAAGTTCDETVCLADTMATCADAVGVDLPHNAAEDSFSFLPALLSQLPRGRHARDHVVHHSAAGVFAMRQGRWKLCFGLGSGGATAPRSEDPQPGGPEGQLYDMADDWRETTDLWCERPEVVRELTVAMTAHRERGRTRPGPVAS